MPIPIIIPYRSHGGGKALTGAELMATLPYVGAYIAIAVGVAIIHIRFIGTGYRDPMNSLMAGLIWPVTVPCFLLAKFVGLFE